MQHYLLGMPFSGRLAALLLLVAFVAGCDSSDDDSPPTSGTVEVSAQANVFAAGRADVPDLEGGGGILPVRIDIPASENVRFPSVTGTVSPNPDKFGFNGPDGGARDSTDILSYKGISGIVHESTFFFLVGVFVGENAPTPPAPQRLDVTDAEEQSSFSPKIGQVFYIGNGRSASGTPQRFAVPAGATRLYLGFSDTTTEQGAPAFYDDNESQLEADFRFDTPQ